MFFEERIQEVNQIIEDEISKTEEGIKKTKETLLEVIRINKDTLDDNIKEEISNVKVRLSDYFRM